MRRAGGLLLLAAVALTLAVNTGRAEAKRFSSRAKKADSAASGGRSGATVSAGAYAGLRKELAARWTVGGDDSEAGCVAATAAIAAATAAGVNSAGVVEAVADFVFTKYYAVDGLPQTAGLAAANRCAAELMSAPLAAIGRQKKGTAGALPTPARVVLLALFMRAAELMELLIAAGVPMWCALRCKAALKRWHAGGVDLGLVISLVLWCAGSARPR